MGEITRLLFVQTIVVEVHPEFAGDEAAQDFVLGHDNREMSVALTESAVAQPKHGLDEVFAVFVGIAGAMNRFDSNRG